MQPDHKILVTLRNRLHEQRLKYHRLDELDPNVSDELRHIVGGERAVTRANVGGIARAVHHLVYPPVGRRGRDKDAVERFWKRFSADLAAALAPDSLPDLREVDKLTDVFYRVCNVHAASPRTAADIKEAVSPFAWRKPITDESLFFGREAELRRLRDTVVARNNLQLIGPRRIGKSSLLRAVQRRLKGWAGRSVFAYVDMLNASCHTLDGFHRSVARQWDLKHVPTSPAEFSEQVDETVSAEVQPVLALDECEKFIVLAAEFSVDFFENLRSKEELTILTASRNSLGEIRKSGGLLSPYYNTFPLLEVGPFRDPEAREYLDRRRNGTPPFTAEEKQRISQDAGCHPLKLAACCDHVLRRRETGASLESALLAAEREIRELLGEDYTEVS